MKKIREMTLYLIVIIPSFYVLAVLINDTGTGIFFLLILIPIICFLTSLIYGIRHSFNLIFLLIFMILFVPTIFLFYNESAAVYVLIYGIIATTGNILGSLIKKMSN